MTQPGQVMWGKFFLMMAGGGWGLMRVVTPTEDQLYNKLAPDLKARVDAARAKRKASDDMREQMQKAGAGETDKIVWGDAFSQSDGRKV